MNLSKNKIKASLNFSAYLEKKIRESKRPPCAYPFFNQ